MRFSLSNRLTETFNIYIFSLSISYEDDWNKKQAKPFSKASEYIELSADIKDKRAKYILDCYTKDSQHIHLIQKGFINNTIEEEIEIMPEDIYVINISHLMESPGCLCPWLSPVISASGDLTLCCNDSLFELNLGNLNDREFPYLWFESEKIQKYRYSHIVGDYENMKTCQRCLNVKSIPLDQKLLNEYTRKNSQLSGITKLYNARVNKKKIIKHLMLELTSICQNKCVYCNQQFDTIKSSRDSKDSLIDPEKLKELFKRFKEKDYFFENIHLFWLGEPMLHPQIKEIFDLILKNKEIFSRLELHTNAIALDDNIIEHIKNINVPIRFHYSLDAIKKDTYKKLKRNEKLSIAEENVKRFILETKDNDLITHVVQFIIHEENQLETEDFIKFWENFFSDNELEYQITTFFDFNKKHILYFRKWDGLNEEENIASDRLFFKKREEIRHKGNEGYVDIEDMKNKKTLNSVCFSPFEYLVISSNGNTTFCCHDTMLENTDINLFEIELPRFEEKLREFFERYLKGEIKLCSSCPIRGSENSHNTVLEHALYFCRRFNIDTKEILSREFL